MSLANYGENAALGAIANEVWIKLHTGDPGEEGTSNAATEATRKKVTLAAASGGTRKNSTTAEWTAVSTTETYKYFSLWDASTAGNCFGSGPLEPERSVASGDNVKVEAEKISVTLD
jgi:hypothetical protein